MKTKILTLGGAFLAVPAVWLYLNSRFHAATAPYTVLRTEGDFEFREYPVRIVATTPIEDGQNPGFMRLYRFITGENAKAEKIPMTTPVLMDSSTGRQEMSFVLPEEMAGREVPAPKGNAVRLKQIEPGCYVVLRFKGGTDNANRDAVVARLQGWLRERNITAEGDPLVAYYDPPWTPGWMRRNEVMVRVESR